MANDPLFHLFMGPLLRWLEIGGVVLFVGAVSFREMCYLPASRSVGDLGTRKGLLKAEDANSVQGLRRILYVLIVLHLTRLYNAEISVFIATIWGIKLGLLGLLLFLIRSQATWRGSLFFGMGTLLCLMGSLSGHAVSGENYVLVLTDWLHFSAVSIWAGGLLPLRDAARRSKVRLDTSELAAFLARLIEVFSIWAIFCVITIVMTGGFNAMIYLSPGGDILEEAYGKVLSVKLSIVSIAIGLGGISQFYILPRLKKIKASAKLVVLEKQLYHVLTVEVIFVAFVLACAALLTQTSMP